jgi:hypothetical protein
MTDSKKMQTFAVSKGNFPQHLIKALEQRGNWQ